MSSRPNKFRDDKTRRIYVLTSDTLHWEFERSQLSLKDFVVTYRVRIDMVIDREVETQK